MNDRQIAWKNMASTTVSVCHDHESVWTSDTHFSGALTEIETNLTEIEAQEVIQNENITGIAEQKQILRDALIEKTKWVAVRILSYATVTGNAPLANAVKMAESSYTRLSADKLFSFATTVHEKGTENATALASYGITSTDLTDLAAKITAYHTFKDEPVKALEIRRNATNKIKQLIKDTNKIFKKRLDVFAMIYQSTAPDFYSLYKLAREIHDHPTTTMALRGHVIDQETTQPLANVNVHVAPGIDRITTASGIFEVTDLPEGTYNIDLECPGYQPQTFPVTIIQGQTTDVTIPMVRS
ncbi:MAG TPA: carboxypeptidase regulatory-like domain-containing protein [Bacteroidia bacterium]|nr:carboxypeptidase regulatory-like domain-containing protein [Bacteroidia bacterium]HRS59529.1 carboxypeptidase regulatory-like domain-containing protein [Bacteroidia bacterium]HRU67579.1 carboxypeptidase regulatory-like domain-containing protein [Bacteroidia bacterium]